LERYHGVDVFVLTAPSLPSSLLPPLPRFQEASSGRSRAEDARDTSAAALARANARIAELTSKSAQLTRWKWTGNHEWSRDRWPRC